LEEGKRCSQNGGEQWYFTMVQSLEQIQDNPSIDGIEKPLSVTQLFFV